VQLRTAPDAYCEGTGAFSAENHDPAGTVCGHLVHLCKEKDTRITEAATVNATRVQKCALFMRLFYVKILTHQK
jgi:hypothetical protein